MENEKRNESEIQSEMAIPSPEKSGKKRQDPVVIGLMFGVSFLCLCITGVMIYWLTAFLM